jgi:hypothetical protein
MNGSEDSLPMSVVMLVMILGAFVAAWVLTT